MYPALLFIVLIALIAPRTSIYRTVYHWLISTFIGLNTTQTTLPTYKNIRPGFGVRRGTQTERRSETEHT